MFRRPPARLVLLLAAVLLIVAVLGIGLLRAAMYRAPEQARPTGAAAAPGPAGHCGQVPVRATRELRGMWLTTVLNIDFPSRPGLPEAQVKAEYQKWLDL